LCGTVRAPGRWGEPEYGRDPAFGGGGPVLSYAAQFDKIGFAAFVSGESEHH